MAGVPCVNDTCSITAAVDVNGRLELAARLSALGGITCGTIADPNDGLRVNILGEPVAVSEATLGPCDNLLGITTEGKLFVKRPQYEQFNNSGASVSFPAGSQTANSNNYTITNNAACPRLVIVRTRFAYTYSTTDNVPYINNGAFTVDAGPTYGPSSYPFEIAGGSTAFGATNNNQGHTGMGLDFFTIPASAAVTMTTYATRNTEVGTITNETFRAFQQLLVLDMAAGDLFS